jgi:hypothetical protein
MKLCNYGCGQEAKYQFKNGKLCCELHRNKCPEMRLKNIKGQTKRNFQWPYESIQKMSDSRKGNKNGMYQKQHTSETKEKLKTRLKNKTYEELYGIEKAQKLKENYSKKMKGRKAWNKNLKGYLTEESRKKISISSTLENNPNWKGGISKEPYCLIFDNKQFRNIIFERDHYTCQNCGITKMLSFKVFQHDLMIHHINYKKKDCDLRNLITICNSCNSKANFNRSFWSLYYTNLIEK